MAELPSRSPSPGASQPVPSGENESLQGDATKTPSTGVKDDIDTEGLNLAPKPVSTDGLELTATEHHDADLGTKDDEPESKQHTSPPAHSGASTPESQLTSSSSVKMSRSPKRSSSHDGRLSSPGLKRHKRETPEASATAPSSPGRDSPTLAGPSLIPDLSEIAGLAHATAEPHDPDPSKGEDGSPSKQHTDPPPRTEESPAGGSQPVLDTKLSSSDHKAALFSGTSALFGGTSALFGGTSATPFNEQKNAPSGSAISACPAADSRVSDDAGEKDDSESESEPEPEYYIPYKDLNEMEASAVREFWDDFRKSCRIFVNAGLPHKCSWDKLPVATQDEIRTWLSHPQDHINSDRSFDVEHFLVAWLYRLFDYHLFSGKDPEKWNGPEWQAFGTIKASVKARVGDPNELLALKYHHWRNLSVQTLGETLPEQRHVDPGWLRGKVEDWVKRLPFPPKSLPKEIVWRELIESAIHMDSIMITARRDIRMQLFDPITRKDHDFPLVPEKMTEKNLSWPRVDVQDRVVDYIIFPEILVYGATNQVFPHPDTDPAGSILKPFGSDYDTFDKMSYYGENELQVVCRRVRQ